MPDDKKHQKHKDDIVFEPEEESGFKGKSQKKLRKELKECEAEKKEYLDGWQRARADFSNLKKKLETETKKSRKNGQESVVTEILPVLDSFEMAFNGEAWDKVDSKWRQGVEYIYSQLLSALENFDVKQINPEGDVFDPEIHTSVESIETDEEKEDGYISEVVQKGYIMEGRIVRSPKVKVFVFKGE